MSSNILADFGVLQPQPSDDQLLFEAKSGNQRAFTELCLRYSAMLKHRIFSIVRHQEDAEDVLQETFLNAYRHLSSFRGTCRFSTWVMRIGINASIMLLRKRKTMSERTGDVVTNDGEKLEPAQFRDPQPNPEQRYMTYQTLLSVRHATQELPPQLRGVIDLHYGNDQSVKDAAETLGITVAAAKSRLLRARRVLRGSLNRRWNEAKERC